MKYINEIVLYGSFVVIAASGLLINYYPYKQDENINPYQDIELESSISKPETKLIVLDGTEFKIPSPKGGIIVEPLEEYKRSFDEIELNSFLEQKLVSVYTFTPLPDVEVKNCRVRQGCYSYVIPSLDSPKICYLVDVSFFSQILAIKDRKAEMLEELANTILKPLPDMFSTHFLQKNEHSVVYYYSRNDLPFGRQSIVKSLIFLKDKVLSAKCFTHQYLPTPTAVLNGLSLEQDILEWEKIIIPSWVDEIVKENIDE